MANMISVSFKNNSEEMKVYEFLKSKTSPSAFVKELVMEHMKGHVVNKITEVQSTQTDVGNKPKTKQLKGISSIAK